MLTRRTLIGSAGIATLTGCAGERLPAAAARAPAAEPLPLADVRLTPSIFRHAVDTNLEYLASLNPDRLLHNFHVSAGLSAKAQVYGGWEARGIAGHSLGHHLSACALMLAQTGDPRMRERIAYLTAELARCQLAHGDGYLGGTTVERDGTVVDGKVVFEELRRGEIRTGGFDVNGGWVPLYTWHKVHAGLLDAYRYGGDDRALTVLLGMAGYLATILEALDDTQMQRLLVAEHGGLNESYAETYAVTGDPRWLNIARRIRHRAVLEPLGRGENVLPGLHANTQIPKVIGLARLHELTGDPVDGEIARFFHALVTGPHAYVIGGHSEREHFRQPGVIAAALNDRTCEACNSYNMLKLTRHLFAWAPDGRLFDYYERTQLNHIMAHQHPDSGMFAYFMPLASGSGRTYSTPTDSFWCCVGSGMESHAKHGDSIYWQAGTEQLFVNLFIPSKARWVDGAMQLTLATDYPHAETVRLDVDSAPDAPRTLALRLPGWCSAPRLAVNGHATDIVRSRGYALVRRIWRAGDTLTLTLPMALTVEAAPDAADTVSFRHGPLVLAADLGPSDHPLEAPPPALVGVEPLSALTPAAEASLHYRLGGIAGGARVKPFFSQYEQRTAVYFPTLTHAQWRDRQAAFQTARQARQALDRRTVDSIDLGNPQSEAEHGFRTNHSDVIAWEGGNGRQAWWGEGNYIEFALTQAAGAQTLRVTYAGEEIDKAFDIYVGGEHLLRETRPGPPVPGLVAVEYPLPTGPANGDPLTVRFETRGSDAPVYECRIVRQEAESA